MKPFYSVNFNARMCHMKITINEIPLFSMEVDGQCSTRYPFNHLLLESGRATIKYEARPLKGEVQLRKDAYLSCEVELFDLESANYQPISSMASYETPKIDDTIIPYFMYKDIFQVNLPYTLGGWKQSVKLDRFDDHLRPMVFMKYNSIIAMMRNHSFSQYENAFRERESIMGTCLYMSESDKQDRIKEVREAILNCSEIVPLSGTDKLELAADGRLVRLVKQDGESALRVRNDIEGEVTAFELWLHMKPGSTELTII